MPKILRQTTLIAASLAAAIAATPAQADPRGWDRASSIVRTGLVAISIGIPAGKSDWPGLKQDALAMGVASAVTGGLKLSVKERRPDGSDNHSFPSGHTSISFAAAAGLEQRYGWTIGVPAHVVAALVGLGRIKADKHYLHDVVFGAAIGEVAGLLLVHQHHRGQSAPIGAGMTIAF